MFGCESGKGMQREDMQKKKQRSGMIIRDTLQQLQQALRASYPRAPNLAHDTLTRIAAARILEMSGYRLLFNFACFALFSMVIKARLEYADAPTDTRRWLYSSIGANIGVIAVLREASRNLMPSRTCI